MAWQKCPRCESNRVIEVDKGQKEMGGFIRFIMESTGLVTFFAAFLLVTFVIYFLTLDITTSTVIGAIAGIIVTVLVVNKFKKPYSGKMIALFCKDCELRF